VSTDGLSPRAVNGHLPQEGRGVVGAPPQFDAAEFSRRVHRSRPPTQQVIMQLLLGADR